MINKSNGFDLNCRFSLPGTRTVAFAFIALLLLLLVIYGNSFDGSWIFDDEPNIIQNKNIQLKTLSWDNIEKTFHGIDQKKITRPVSYFTFGLNYYFGHLNPVGYHAVNLLIHFCSAIFLFLFIYRTLNLPRLKADYGSSSSSIALLAVVFWAVNPVQVTAVTYIVQRMASMAGMFYIMSMYFYLLGRTDEKQGKRIIFFLLSALTAALAMGTKENAVMIPVSLYLYDLLLIQDLNRENLIWNLKFVVLPAAVVACLILLFYFDILSIAGSYSNRPFSLTERLMTEPRVILFYISLLLYPNYMRLTLIHDFAISRSLMDPWTTMPALLIVFGCIGLALWMARKKPLISYCIIFFFLNHLIEGTFIPLELVFEHRNYIPSMLFFVPLSILVIHLLDYFSYKRSVQFMIAALIGFILIAQGHTVSMYNFIFKDPYILWFDSVSKASGLSRPYVNLGNILWEQGLYREAYQSYEKAWQLNRFDRPSLSASALYNMGRYHFLKRDNAQALAHFQAAIKMEPKYANMWVSLAQTQIRMGDLKAAENSTRQALATGPDNVRLHAMLSFVLLKKNENDGALRAAWKTLRLDREFTDVMRVIAEAYRRNGLYERSVSCWEQHTSEYRKDLEGQLALIDLYSKTGQMEKLDRTIARVMVLKGSKSWQKMIDEYNSDQAAHAYVPRKDAFLAIVRKNLLKDF